MNRVVQLETLVGEQLVLQSVQGFEALSSLFELRVVAVSTSDSLALKQFLGSDACLKIETRGSARYLHAIVTQAQALGRQTRTEAYYGYELILRPKLWYLTQSKDSRIFQQQSSVDILKEIFAQYELEVDYQLTEQYRKWGYCVQYDETDFNFVSRLMEHEGIYYYFRHEAKKHTLVLVDAMSAHEDLALAQNIPYVAPDQLAYAPEEYMQDWQMGGQITPTSYVTRDYDFEKPRASIEAYQLFEKQGISDLEIYKPFGGYTSNDEAAFYARVHLEAMQWPQRQGFGETNVRTLAPGYMFNLQYYPVRAENQRYLIIRADYDFRVQAYVTDSEQSARFNITFRAIPATTPYRAPRISKQVKAQGPLSATVVGPKGEEIWTDKYGRIKVQFHWDREGQHNEDSSCWVRVASPWSGGGFGGVQIPRVKEEVVVDFINGQMDRPIVVGRVYNALNMPPVKLPEDATQSGFFTRTKGKDPNNANHLMFEDFPGKERLSMLANRDMDTHVKNNQTVDIAGNVSDYTTGKRLHTAHSTSDTRLESGSVRHYAADHQRIIQTRLKETIQSNNQETYEDGVDEYISGTFTSVVQGIANHHLEEDHKKTLVQDDETVTGFVEEQIQQGDRVNVAGEASLTAGGNIEMVAPTLTVTATRGVVDANSDGTVSLEAANDIVLEGASQLDAQAPTAQEFSINNDVVTQVANIQSTISIKLAGCEDSVSLASQSNTDLDIALTGVNTNMQALAYSILGGKITIDNKKEDTGKSDTVITGISIEKGNQNWKAGAGGAGGSASSKSRKGNGDGAKSNNKKNGGDSNSQSANKKDPKQKQPETKACAKRSRCSIGFALGDEILDHHDFSLPGALPISWGRRYRSNFPEYDERGPIGARWVNEYLSSIEEDVDGRLSYLDSRGINCPMTALKVGETRYDNHEEIYWTRESKQHLRIRNKSFVEAHFERLSESSTCYRLYRIIDRHGNSITLKYNLDGYLSLLSNNLFDLFFTHNEAGKITRIWHYVSDPDSGEKQERTLAEYQYDELADLRESIDEYSRHNTYRYDHHLLTYYSDKTGRGMHLSWDGIGAYARCIREAADDGMFAIQLAWDDAARICKVTDGLGLTTHYHYNHDNYTIAEYFPDGSRILIERDKFNNVIKTSFNDGSTREFEYDQFDNMIREVREDGGITRYEYNDYHQVTKVIEPGGQVWLNRYDDQGNQIEQIDPLERITRYNYNVQGELTQIIDAKGGTKRLLYNPLGLVQSYIDCSSKITQWHYDERYRVTQIVNALGQATDYRYDQYGFVIKQQVEGLAAEYFHHDAEGRLLRYTNGMDQSTHYRYGPSGLLQERRNPLNHSVSYDYDKVGRLKVLRNENFEDYRFIYDPVGRLVESKAFDGKVRRNYYDKTTGHLIKSNFEGQEISYRYDVMGNLLERRSPDDVEYFDYDINQDLTCASNAHATHEMRYDPLGNLIEQQQRISLFNQIRLYNWQYTYDELYSPIQITRPDGRVVDYLRYGSGHLHGILLDKETLADFERDNLHREVKRSLAEQIHQKTVYDTGGRLSEQQVKLGRYGQRKLQESHYQYDLANRIVGIEDSRLGKTSYRYDALDRLIQASTPRGQETFAFDPAHNLVAKSETASGAESRTPRTTGAQGASPRNTLPAGVSAVMGNLLKSIAGIHFEYDAQGNMIEKISDKGRQSLSWDGFNQLKSVRHEQRKISRVKQAHYYYDALGLRIGKEVRLDDDAPPIYTVFSWDGMVLGVEEQFTPLSEQASLEQSLQQESRNFSDSAWSSETSPTQTGLVMKATHYVYEEAGSYIPIAQYAYQSGGSGLAARSVTSSVERLGDGLSSDTDAKGNTRTRGGVEHTASAMHYYLNDHLGTPQALFNQAQEIVWQSQAKAWGETEALVGVDAESGGTSEQIVYSSRGIYTEKGDANAIHTPLRFQGQYEDSETELHYNTFRYYDPEIGRFISQDPIGLMGGINLYQYAPNPVEWVDPWGWNRFKPITWTAPERGTGQTYKVFQRDDINWDLIDPKGRTNLQRAGKGLAPIGPDGRSINLHHSKQDARGALFELLGSTHSKYDRSNALHPYKVSGEGKHPYHPVDREAFAKDRKQYWRDRAKAEKRQRRANKCK